MTDQERKLLELTTKVGKAIYPNPNCWGGSLILRDLILRQYRWVAEVIPCSVTVGDWTLDEHCVVDCCGYLCDVTAFQIPTAPMVIVAEGDTSGLQVGNVLYRPCVSREYVEIVGNSWSVGSSEAVSFGTISEEELETLLVGGN